MKTLLRNLALSCLLFAAACSAQTSENVQVIDQQAYLEITKEMNTVQLVDVRTPGEYAEGYINDAVNINFFDQDFVSQCEVLDKTQPVFIYCQSGGRSAKASAKLEAAGFTTVYDLGGYKDWKK